MPYSNHINYIEFKAVDLKEIKSFYEKVFNWEFTDYGDEYMAFSNSGVEGGFMKTDQLITNGVLVVLYHQNLEEIFDEVKSHGGIISEEIFSFPGGRRFHFKDPSGNELAIWSE